MLPLSPLTVYAFGATIGFLWLGTVPLTNGLIAQVFGTQYLSTLGGSAFLFHQVGSFLGVWLAGYLFDATGSYGLMWTLTIGMGVVAALLNLPIDERADQAAAAVAGGCLTGGSARKGAVYARLRQVRRACSSRLATRYNWPCAAPAPLLPAASP